MRRQCDLCHSKHRHRHRDNAPSSSSSCSSSGEDDEHEEDDHHQDFQPTLNSLRKSLSAHAAIGKSSTTSLVHPPLQLISCSAMLANWNKEARRKAEKDEQQQETAETESEEDSDADLVNLHPSLRGITKSRSDYTVKASSSSIVNAQRINQMANNFSSFKGFFPLDQPQQQQQQQSSTTRTTVLPQSPCSRWPAPDNGDDDEPIRKVPRNRIFSLDSGDPTIPAWSAPSSLSNHRSNNASVEFLALTSCWSAPDELNNENRKKKKNNKRRASFDQAGSEVELSSPIGSPNSSEEQLNTLHLNIHPSRSFTAGLRLSVDGDYQSKSFSEGLRLTVNDGDLLQRPKSPCFSHQSKSFTTGLRLTVDGDDLLQRPKSPCFSQSKNGLCSNNNNDRDDGDGNGNIPIVMAMDIDDDNDTLTGDDEEEEEPTLTELYQFAAASPIAVNENNEVDISGGERTFIFDCHQSSGAMADVNLPHRASCDGEGKTKKKSAIRSCDGEGKTKKSAIRVSSFDHQGKTKSAIRVSSFDHHPFKAIIPTVPRSQSAQLDYSQHSYWQRIVKKSSSFGNHPLPFRDGEGEEEAKRLIGNCFPFRSNMSDRATIESQLDNIILIDEKQDQHGQQQQQQQQQQAQLNNHKSDRATIETQLDNIILIDEKQDQHGPSRQQEEEVQLTNQNIRKSASIAGFSGASSIVPSNDRRRQQRRLLPKRPSLACTPEERHIDVSEWYEAGIFETSRRPDIPSTPSTVNQHDGYSHEMTSRGFIFQGQQPVPIQLTTSMNDSTHRRLPQLPIKSPSAVLLGALGRLPTMLPSTVSSHQIGAIDQQQDHRLCIDQQDHRLCFGMTDSVIGRSTLMEDSYYEDGLNGNQQFARKGWVHEDSSGVSSCTASEHLQPTHRVQWTFIPRHHDEILLEVGDALHVERECEDHWCQGTNLRTGHQGIFPFAHICEIDLVDEICTGAIGTLPVNLTKMIGKDRDTFFLTMLASIEVAHHKGNDVLVQAMNKVLAIYQNRDEIIAPQTVLMEISFRGIHIIDKRKKNFFRCPTFDYFYSLQNISFCGAHPKQLRYFGFISKHPLLPRFACHVFLSNESTQVIVEAIGRAFKRSYDEYMAFAHPTEDIYID